MVFLRVMVKIGMVRRAVESVNVFTSWLSRSLLLTSMRFDSSLSTKIKIMSKTMRLLKDYAVCGGNTWLLLKLEQAELEVAIEATKDVVNILEI